MKRHSAIWLVLLLAAACQPGGTVPRQEAAVLSGEVTYDEILTADQLPGHWLTYSGGYRSWRYSGLDQVTTANVHRLRLDWRSSSRAWKRWRPRRWWSTTSCT